MTDLTSSALIRAVRSLSLDADEQLHELCRLGCPDVVDELALQFHDQAVLADQLFSSGQITEKELSLVRRIDELLVNMSGEVNAALWTPAALRSSPAWEQVRQLAREFIATAR
jgi:hypothetical protein